MVLKKNTWEGFNWIMWKILLISCQAFLLAEAKDSSSDVRPTSFRIIARPLPDGISSAECLKSDVLLHLLICGDEELIRTIHSVPVVDLCDEQVIHCCRAGSHTGFLSMKSDHIGPLPGNRWHADMTCVHVDRKQSIDVRQLVRQEACWKLTDILVDNDTRLQVPHCLTVRLEDRRPGPMAPQPVATGRMVLARTSSYVHIYVTVRHSTQMSMCQTRDFWGAGPFQHRLHLLLRQTAQHLPRIP